MSDRFGMTGNYLIHSAKGTSWEKKDHKYTYKKNINGKWKYFYTIKDLEEAEKELKDAENNEDSIGGRYRSEYTKERIDNLGKYKRGEYFDKDHPGNMAAYYQNEDYALQRMSSDANKALKRVENAKENLNKIENSKSGKIAKTIRDTSKSVKKFVDTGNVVIDGTGYQIIPKKKK